MIPPKDNPIWEKIVKKKIDYKFSNYILQLHVFHIQSSYAIKQMDIDKAIDELYRICTKYEVLVKNDFQKLLNEQI